MKETVVRRRRVRAGEEERLLPQVANARLVEELKTRPQRRGRQHARIRQTVAVRDSERMRE
jgi:hypothetical protein